jgi:hypothetical protein
VREASVEEALFCLGNRAYLAVVDEIANEDRITEISLIVIGSVASSTTRVIASA